MLNNKEILVATFYKFVTLNDLEELRPKLLNKLKELEIKGTILIASEGINSTISGNKENIYKFFEFLKSDERFSDITHKESYTDTHPFKRTLVKIKKEIVTFKAHANPNEQVGQYVDPQNWNKLIKDPEVLVIDTRNDFEYEMGTFEGSIDPQTSKFSEIKEFTEKLIKEKKPKKVAMFCTGGIRCEKYSSYMLNQGVKDVYHLKGGILKYLEDIPPEKSLWKGDCFVFDHREKVNHETFKN